MVESYLSKYLLHVRHYVRTIIFIILLLQSLSVKHNPTCSNKNEMIFLYKNMQKNDEGNINLTSSNSKSLYVFQRHMLYPMFLKLSRLKGVSDIYSHVPNILIIKRI